MNEYQKREKENAEKMLAELSGLFPNTDIKARVIYDDNQMHFIPLFTYEDKDFMIRCAEYRKEYYISRYPYQRATETTSYNREKILNSILPAPNKIHKLNQKAVLTHIKYINEFETLVLKAEAEAKEKRLAFVAKVTETFGNEIKWNKDKTSGEVIRNGLVYSFHAVEGNDGYVQQDIKIHYSINNTIEDFIKLTEK